jgi:hypothetical protein
MYDAKTSTWAAAVTWWGDRVPGAPEELRQQERKLLVGSPMQDRSKGRGQTNGKPRSYIWELDVGLITSPRKTNYVKKPNDGFQMGEQASVVKESKDPTEQQSQWVSKDVNAWHFQYHWDRIITNKFHVISGP